MTETLNSSLYIVATPKAGAIKRHTNKQSVLSPWLLAPQQYTRSSATAEKQRVSCAYMRS